MRTVRGEGEEAEDGLNDGVGMKSERVDRGAVVLFERLKPRSGEVQRARLLRVVAGQTCRLGEAQ